MKRRIAALLTAAALALSLAACTQNPQSGKMNTGANTESGEKLFSEPTTIKLMVGSHPSWPYNENWIMWKLFQEKTGASFEINAVPSSDMGTKVNLLMTTPDQLPDMIFLIGDKATPNSHGPEGAFIAISDHLDQMPNYKKFWEGVPEKERQDSMLQRVSGDGKIYFPPNYGIQTVGNTRAWLYRKDIFEKHHLKTPETMEEMYQTAKKLKELYPDSYPISMRSGFQNFNLIGSEWKPYFTMQPYYDYSDGTWHYGVVEPEMKEMVEYFRKLVAEGLIPPDFLTIATKSWEELVITNRGFMMPEYLLRIDHFNLPARAENPEYTWAVMKPPRADTPTGQNKIANLAYELTGYVVCNTKDQKRIDNALKLLDWMYSPEGIEFQSWGEEGKTYEVVNGERKWLVEENGSPYGELGMGTPGLYQCVEFEANEALYSEEQGEQGKIARPYQEERISPFTVLGFADDLIDERSDLFLAIDTYAQEMISKFIMAQTPMSEWDAFQERIKSMGVDRLLELYTEMYERIQETGIIQ